MEAIDAFNRRDLDALVALCHVDVEWTPPAELPGSRTYHGHDGVREAIGDMTEVFPDLRAEPVEFVEGHDRLAAHYMWRGSALGSGVAVDPFEVHAGCFAQFRDGKVASARFWTAWEPALEASGLAS